MKRVPLIVSFLLFILLCASAAYWAMQLFKPPLRPVAAPPRAAQAEVQTAAAAALFGGRIENVAVASNYQLKGVIYSGSPRNSVAILSADGKPAQAVRVDMEVAPGVTVKEVHREYVLLSEGDVTKRVELPESATGQVDLASLAPVPVRPSENPPPSQPPPNQSPSPTPPTRAQAAAAAPPPPPNTAPLPTPHSAVAPPASSGSGASAGTSSSSPIPSGIVPSVQPPTAPPTVVVSPPPGGSQQQAAPSAQRQARTMPQPSAPATAAPPTAPAGTQSYPMRPSSPETAPLISR